MNRKVLLLTLISVGCLTLVTRGTLLSLRNDSLAANLVRVTLHTREFVDPFHPKGAATVCSNVVMVMLPDDVLGERLHQVILSPHRGRYPSLVAHACGSDGPCHMIRDTIELEMRMSGTCPLRR